MCARTIPQTHCHHRYHENIFWLGHQNIPHVAVCNQTNVASFAFALSLIYEHGIKSTNFPQACWTCSIYSYNLYGSVLDVCLSNSSSAWVIIHTHAMCRKLLQATNFDCISLFCQLKLNPTCFVASKANKHDCRTSWVSEKASSASVVNIDYEGCKHGPHELLWMAQCKVILVT